MNKNELRQQLRIKRNALTPDQQQLAAKRAHTFATQLNRYRLSQHIAFYLSFDNEIDPNTLLLHAHQAGKHCYLPVLHPRKIGTLAFMQHKPGDKLIANQFGILEPEYHEQHCFPTWHLDLVFMPLVAFDQHRRRLGMGHGYYDRTFEFLKDMPEPKPYLIGLAYQMQQVEHVPVAAHDINPHVIVTEDGVF